MSMPSTLVHLSARLDSWRSARRPSRPFGDVVLLTPSPPAALSLMFFTFSRGTVPPNQYHWRAAVTTTHPSWVTPNPGPPTTVAICRADQDTTSPMSRDDEWSVGESAGLGGAPAGCAR